MSIQEYQTGQVMVPEVELPEFKAHAPAFNKWERFKRRVDLEWRPTLVYAVVVNIITVGPSRSISQGFNPIFVFSTVS